MPNILFRNRNRKAIREILKLIGQEDYYRSLKNNNLTEQPPMSMEGFYLEFCVETKDIDIWYQYSGGTCVKLLSALGYWEVPVKGWEMVWRLSERKLLKQET